MVGIVRAGSHLVAELLLQRLAGQRMIGDCRADLPRRVDDGINR
jgi:hypothetical protein